MQLDLEGKRVLITGASKGIGLATAWAFAKEGCELYLAARSLDQLEKNREEILRQHKTRVTVCAADMGSSADIKKLAEQFCETDILVNNAGDIPAGDLDSVDEDAWRKGWDVKVYGYVNLTRYIYRRMVDRKSPHRRGGSRSVQGSAWDTRCDHRYCGSRTRSRCRGFLW
jgi:NADP-dependent 3-hydroxy acid dehydrogenase YdfG